MLADDWVFGWEVDHDPSMPNHSTVPVRYIDSATALDDTTLVLHWSQTYPHANALIREHLNPMQRAKHEALFKADRERFITSPAWNFEYIGLGPFRLAEWTQGAQLRYEAFGDYFLGRPKLDTIVVRFLNDPNTLIANILSESIDVYLPLGLEKEAALDLQKGWAAAGTGNQIFIYPDGRLRYVEVQMRPDYQRPRALNDRKVREALLRIIDRQEFMEVAIAGLGKTADSWVLPDDPARDSIYQGTIPDYGHDTQRAQRLLEEAGFRRGADGTLVHQPSGERFETAVWNTRGGGHDKENSLVADHMRAMGILMEQYIIPTSRMDDREHRPSFPGLNITSRTVTFDFENALFRYRGPRSTEPLGTPRNGYNNPKLVALVDRLQVAVGQGERSDVQRQIMQTVMHELPILPLHWDVETLTVRKGVTGPAGRTGRHVNYPLTTWNIAEWDRSSE
jgi:peptide/nickel transport system substrate-binding protein